MINVEFWGNTKGAFDAFPNEFRMEKNTFTSCEGPYGIWRDISIDMSEMVDEMGVTPLDRITGNVCSLR